MAEREMIQRWVHSWKAAAPELEKIRRREIQEADNLKVLPAFNLATRTLPPRASSKMVEMQRLFAELRPRNSE